MRSIYKYNVIEAKSGIIEGPIIKLLSAQVQHENIVVWAEVDTDAPVRKFQVIPIGTGWPLDPPAGRKCVLDTHTFLGTVQLAGGALIFHVYYKELTPATVEEKVVDDKSKKATFTCTNSKIDLDVLKKFIQ